MLEEWGDVGRGGWMEEDGREEKLWQRSTLRSVAVSVGRWLGCPHVGM